MRISYLILRIRAHAHNERSKLAQQIFADEVLLGHLAQPVGLHLVGGAARQTELLFDLCACNQRNQYTFYFST